MTKTNEGAGKALKAGVWYIFCSIILKGATMLMTPVYTRLMTTAEYGENASIGTWFTMLGTIATVDLCNSINRAKYDFPGRLDQYISSITWLGTIITAIVYAVFICFSDFFTELLKCRVEFIHVIFMVLLFTPAMAMLQTRNRLENKYRLVVFLSIGTWLISSAASLLMLVSPEIRTFFMGELAADRVFSMFAGSHVVTMLINLCIYVWIMMRGRCLVQWSYWKYALKICLPLIPHLLAGYILTSSDRLMIHNLCGAEATALYSITYTCSAIVSMFFNALNQAWVPWFNDQYFYSRDQKIWQTSKVYFLIFFAIVFCCIIIAPEMLLIIGGKQYVVAQYIMPVVMISCFFQFTNAFFVNVEMFEKRTVFTAIGTSIAAVMNVVLNYWLIPIYGYQVAAYTTLFSFAFLFVFHSIICYKLIGNKLKQIYPLKLFVACLCIMLAFMLPAIVLYDYPLCRYALCLVVVVVIGAVLIKYRDQVKMFIKQKIGGK